jgi:hypothetical protein
MQPFRGWKKDRETLDPINFQNFFYPAGIDDRQVRWGWVNCVQVVEQAV